ncbi:hypothetical protein CYLTODRAFT_423484 [Cylindrobasidium torrendii FP15055 ss-10]|uniref:Uncharacterized protein n=1 Tax=Cylindrobasidium torrendii FP15055 ss-10 TaxID=1314674 RepID=A0A0D7B772_9AGAR|nr:hypothetical protein CYLTODRAFT_423484 [Cylindrobasidium torrendii FP15055 ss-10]
MGVTTRSAARRDSLIPDDISTLNPTTYKDQDPSSMGDMPPPPTSPATNAHWHEFRRMVGPSIRAEFEARGEHLTSKKLRRAISLRWAQMKIHMETKQLSDSLPQNASSSRAADNTHESGDEMVVDVPEASLCPQSAQTSPTSPCPFEFNTEPGLSNIDHDLAEYIQDDDKWIAEFEALVATLPAPWNEELDWGKLLDLSFPNAAPLHDSNPQAGTVDEWSDWYDPKLGTETGIGDSDKEMLGETQEFFDIFM